MALALALPTLDTKILVEFEINLFIIIVIGFFFLGGGRFFHLNPQKQMFGYTDEITK